MALIPNPYKCDVCGRAKGEGNGWLLGIPLHYRDGHCISSITPCLDYSGYAIISWDERAAGYPNSIHHLCSEQCALVKQSEYLRR